jgi:hypothetical protein
MASTWFVEVLDEVEDRSLGLMPSEPDPLIDQLGLQGGKERLHKRVVMAVANCSHRRHQAGLVQPLTICHGGALGHRRLPRSELLESHCTLIAPQHTIQTGDQA